MKAGLGCGAALLAGVLGILMIPVFMLTGPSSASAAVSGPGSPAATGKPSVVAADGSCSSPAVGRQRPALPSVPACGYPDSFVTPPGECTSWAAFNWPGHHGAGVTWSGDAWEWFVNAASQGYVTADTPSVGAIVVVKKTSEDGGEWGHVAIVTKVDPGSFTVSEMNVSGRFVVDLRTLPWPSSRPGLAGFIPVPVDSGEAVLP